MKGRASFALAAVTVLAAIGAPAAAKPPTSLDPVVEAQNYSITLQRQAIYDTPQYQARLAAASSAGTTGASRKD